jgi:hypothetical protein
MSAATDRITTIGIILDEIDASMDHLNQAIDTARKNKMENFAIEILGIKTHLWGMRKDLTRDVAAIREAELEHIRQGTYKPC